MLLALQQKIARVLLLAHGICAEIAFCRTDTFSVLVDDQIQFRKAKDVMAFVGNVKFDSEDRDDDCGHIAYYMF